MSSLIAAGVLGPGTPAFPEPQPDLRVCLLEANLPLSAREGEKGFDIDTAKAVAEALRRTFVPLWVKNDTQILEVEESDFPLRRLGRGECDAIFSVPGADAIKDSPKAALGAPYYGAAFELIGREGSVPAGIEAVGDNAVAVQAQTVANFFLNARKVKMQTFFSVDAALAGVAKGEAAAALVWGPTGGWYLHNHPDAELVFAAGSEPPAAVRWNEHVATRKDDAALRTAIDDVLTKLRDAGTLQTLAARYGMPFHKPFATTYSVAEMERLR
jgi:ABC-type amino acid transport substrate-binding protein